LIGFGRGGVVTTRTGEHVETEIAAPLDPLIVLHGEDGSDEADQRGAVGEDPDHIGSPADFLIEALLRIVAPDLFQI
jgi:hypothetical protein